MKSQEKKPRSRSFKMCFGLIMFSVIVLISVVSLTVIGYVLVENAKQTGSEVAYAYSMKEEHNIESYMSLLEIGAGYVEEYTKTGAQEEEISRWINDYFDRINEVAGENVIDPYAVVNGTIIAANPWENDESYEAEKTKWYQRAMEEPEKVIFTDAYIDAIYHKPVITIAKKCGEASVMAFDIFPENFRVHAELSGLPEGSAYYLCDKKGTILYHNTPWDETQEKAQNYINSIFPSILENSVENKIFEDWNGKKCIIYYTQVENGWYSVLTMPFSGLLQSLWIAAVLYVAVFILFLSIAYIMWKRDFRLNKDMERTNETINILSNSFYAIYRVNFVNGSYEMIKGSRYVSEHMEKRGSYEELLCVWKHVISKEAYEEFRESFSLENIQKLVEQQTGNFGGDFLRSFEGVYKWVNVQLLTVPELKAEAILCFREVDEEKRRQLQHIKLLENALDTAHKSEASQKQFFSNMSHDMRTPLNVIIGMSEMAVSYEKNPEKMSDYMKKINVSSKQLLGLINDILEISRLEQGLRLENEEFNFRKSAEECCKVFQTQAKMEDKNFDSSFEIQDEVVRGDALRLNQIMNNLLSNALKFTEKGDSIAVKVTQISQEEYAKYQIEVRDTGIGMSQEFQKRLFTPYEREKRFEARNVMGTGLGMAIVKNLISHMNGEICVRSKPGEGTAFTLVIPLEVVRRKEQKAVCSEEEKRSYREYSLKGKKVLLVEDYEMNMEIATGILEMWEAHVTPARNGREALEIFTASKEFDFDLILMDMQMPEMDGCEAAKAIRALPRKDAQKVLIVALTANAFAEDVALTREAGMNAHVSKPIDVNVLCSTLDKLLNA